MMISSRELTRPRPESTAVELLVGPTRARPERLSVTGLLSVTGRLSVIGLACLMMTQAGCSSSRPPVENPDVELLEQPSDDVAAPSSAEVKKGIEAIQAEDFEGAKAHLLAARKENPADPQATYYLAVAYDGLGDGANAAKTYQEALDLDPKLTEASQNLSAILVEQGDAAGALSVAEAGLEHAPDNPGLLANRALALEAAGSPDAVPAYAKALEKAPEDPNLRYNYAQALAGAGQREAAIAELKKIPTTEPEFASAVATTFGQLQAFDDCIAVLDTALVKTPNADLYTRRGVCHHGKQDEAGALADFQKAVETDDGFAPAHYYLGRHLAMQGKPQEARAHLEKAAKLGQGTPVGAAAQKTLSKLK